SWGSYDNVGASVKDSLPIISSACPPGHQITFFMRYQLPHKPEHILKEGVATVVVGGSVQPPPSMITVTRGAPATAAFTPTFPVAATASSGLPVAIGATGACSTSSGTVTMTSGTGTCTVTFDQAGDANPAAAPQ